MEALAEQKGTLDLSKWISFFACDHSLVPSFSEVYDIFISGMTLCMILRQYSFPVYFEECSTYWTVHY